MDEDIALDFHGVAAQQRIGNEPQRHRFNAAVMPFLAQVASPATA